MLKSQCLFEMFALACHQVVCQDELFDDVICHQLSTVHNGVTSYVWQTTLTQGQNDNCKYDNKSNYTSHKEDRTTLFFYHQFLSGLANVKCLYI